MEEKNEIYRDDLTGRYDWSKVLSIIEAARFKLEHGLNLSGEEKRLILKERAKKLAEEPGEEKHVETIEVIKFILANENYGIESSFVKEVIPLKDMTVIPGTPPFVMGIINVRGQIYSILDIKKFFGLPEKGLTNLNRVIILQNKKMEFGILADSIVGISNIGTDELQTSLNLQQQISSKFIKGITPGREIILDAEKLLNSEDIVVNDENL